MVYLLKIFKNGDFPWLCQITRWYTRNGQSAQPFYAQVASRQISLSVKAAALTADFPMANVGLNVLGMHRSVEPMKCRALTTGCNISCHVCVPSER